MTKISTPPKHSSLTHQGASRVLVVDDNPINLAVASGFLKLWGYTAETAKDGMEALELFSTQKYCCILMDIHMPNMSGLEASLAIRRMEESAKSGPIPIVAYTADVFIDDETLSAAKINTKLLKPLKPKDLQTILDGLSVTNISEKMLLL